MEGTLKYVSTPENISRIERGLAPQYRDKLTGKMESVELHHEPPQRDGGLFDFLEVTVDEHKKLDPHRAGFIKEVEGDPRK